MRTEIRNLQRRLARMILFVKAMSTADTIYLLSNGKVLQKGRPKEIYENPRTRYAAEFLGRANISSIDSSGPQLGTRVAFAWVPPSCRSPPPFPTRGLLCIRPEKWRVAPDPGNALASRIVETRYVGDRFEFIADAPIGRLAVVEMSRE